MSDDVTATGRPRRSTRVPTRLAENAAPGPSARPSNRPRQRAPTASAARKAPKDVDQTEQLRVLLQEPKSALTTLDMGDIINLRTWGALSPAARAHLSTFLPPTAFKTHKPTLHPTHPSQASAPPVAPDAAPDADALDPAVFTDAHTLAALRTFQDHLYTGWLAPARAQKVARYEAGVRAGTLHAAWKDETWAAANSTEPRAAVEPGAGAVPESAARAGDAGEWKLQDLAKRGIVRAGDVLAYRRRFSHLGLIVEKDVLIDAIHPKSHSITLLVQRGPARALPAHVVAPRAMDAEDDPSLRSVAVSTPAQIENAVLDLDGRVGRGQRPNGNAWKTLTVWRAREDDGAEAGAGGDPERGGRENCNTLFYLRGSYYQGR